MKLTIEGTEEEIQAILEKINENSKSPQQNSVTTSQYGYKPTESCRCGGCKQPAIISVGWRDSERVMC